MRSPDTALAEQLAQHRSYLLRFARLQLRNDAWAEDAVSETVLAALAKPQSFGNQSQLKTWLVGILKHKVVDILRTQTREASLSFAPSDDDDAFDGLDFLPDGHFRQAPMTWSRADSTPSGQDDTPGSGPWGNPEQELHSRQFFAVLEACTSKLPAAQGRLFLMREWLDMSVEEICKELALTSTNLYVQLHRARLRLRECLELNWFGQQGTSS